MIEEVEELEAEFQIDLFRDIGPLHRGKVKIPGPGRSQVTFVKTLIAKGGVVIHTVVPEPLAEPKFNEDIFGEDVVLDAP